MTVQCSARARAEGAGFTLVEVTIILLVLVVLSSIILPQLGNYNRLARFVKVKEDVGVLCSGLKKMLDEVMEGAFWGDPQDHELPIGLLAGEWGETPGINPLLTGANPPDIAWTLPVPSDATFDIQADVPWGTSARQTFWPDAFENHLQMNSPLLKWTGPGTGFALAATSQYMDVRHIPAEWWAMGWHGPYFDKIDADPWGNRYVANVFGLHSIRGGAFSSPVMVLSAGPNEVIDTLFNMPYKESSSDVMGGYMVGLDDVVCVLSAGGPF